MSLSEFMIRYRDQITNKADIFRVYLRDYYEIYSYIGGEGPFFYFVDNKMYEMHEGDILVLRPGILRGSCKKVRARYRRQYVRFTADVLDTIGELCPEVKRKIAEGDFVRVTLPAEAMAEYAQLMEQVRTVSAQEDPYAQLSAFSCFIRQLVILCRYAESSANSNPASPPSKSSRTVLQTIRYINENWADVSTVDEVARALHYSPNYLGNCFRSQMNIGIHEYLLEKKLYESVAMLLNGKNVGDVAFECGFGGTSYYIRVFKKRYGMTPKAYVLQMKR